MLYKKDMPPKSYPVWFMPAAPLGSAVRYIASLTSQIEWVGISIAKGKGHKAGPSIGTRCQDAEIRVIIRDPKGKIKGQLEIECRDSKSLDTEVDAVVKKVAKELGELWPE